MAQVSEYERLQIESVLLGHGELIEPGVGLFLMPDSEHAQRLHDAAVEPAMRSNELNLVAAVRVFDSDSSLATVCRWIRVAEVIVADLSVQGSDLMYVLGLCHGLGRCPLLLTLGPAVLPFNLQSLRCIEYAASAEGLRDLREHLTRAIRVFLMAARATRR